MSKPRPSTKSAEAKRASAYRKRKRDARDRLLAVVAESPRESSDREPVTREAVAVPVHETEPVTGPGADEFVLLPAGAAEVPPGEPGEHAAPGVTDHPEPVLLTPEPVPEPPKESAQPKKPTTAEQVAIIATGVTMFFSSGIVSMFRRAPDLRVEMGTLFAGLLPEGTPSDPLVYLPAVSAFVHKCTTEVCIKYNIRIPYQEEAVVVLALGVGAFGHFAKFDKSKAKPGEPDPARNTASPDANVAALA